VVGEGLRVGGEGGLRPRRRHGRRGGGHVEFFEDVGVFAHGAVFAGGKGFEARFTAFCADFGGVHGYFLAGGEDGVGEVGRGGVVRRGCRVDCRMALCHFLFVDARDGFFEEGGARGAVRRLGPGGVTSGAGVGKGSRGWGCRGSDVEDCGRSEGEEVIGPFLYSKVSWLIFEEMKLPTKDYVFFLIITNGNVHVLEDAVVASLLTFPM